MEPDDISMAEGVYSVGGMTCGKCEGLIAKAVIEVECIRRSLNLC